MPEILLIQPAGECIHLAEVKNDRRVDDNADDAKIKSLITAARIAVENRTRQQLLHARWKLVLDTFPMAGMCDAGPARGAGGIPRDAIQLPHSPLVRVVAVEYTDMAGVVQTMPPSDYVVNTASMPGILAPAFGRVWPIPLPQVASVSVTYDAGYASPITVGGTLPGGQFRVSGPVTWAVGARVNFYNSGGALPAPLDTDMTYLIASASNGTYTLTDESGGAVAFTDVGTGRSFIGVVPDGIRSWMLLRVGSLYEYREEAEIVQGRKLEIMPYVDSLLIPYIVEIY